MNINTLRKAALTPFIRLIKDDGNLSGINFIGMGFKGEFLYLVSPGHRPERVTITGDEFAFLHKKGDGTILSTDSALNHEQKLNEYRFNDGKPFDNFITIHECYADKETTIETMEALLKTIGDKTNIDTTSVEEALRNAFINVNKAAEEPEVEPEVENVDELTPRQKGRGVLNFQREFMQSSVFAL